MNTHMYTYKYIALGTLTYTLHTCIYMYKTVPTSFFLQPGNEHLLVYNCEEQFTLVSWTLEVRSVQTLSLLFCSLQSLEMWLSTLTLGSSPFFRGSGWLQRGHTGTRASYTIVCIAWVTEVYIQCTGCQHTYTYLDVWFCAVVILIRLVIYTTSVYWSQHACIAWQHKLTKQY